MAKPYIFPPSLLKFIHQFYLKMQQSPSEVIFSRQRIARCDCGYPSVRMVGLGGMPLLLPISMRTYAAQVTGETVRPRHLSAAHLPQASTSDTDRALQADFGWSGLACILLINTGQQLKNGCRKKAI